MLIQHTPNVLSPKMVKAFSTIQEALTTPEQKVALAYLERELSHSLSYIAELEWDTEEAAAIIKQTYGPSSEWVASLDYMEGWARECYSRLDDHRQRKLSCLVRKGSSACDYSL